MEVMGTEVSKFEANDEHVRHNRNLVTRSFTIHDEKLFEKVFQLIKDG